MLKRLILLAALLAGMTLLFLALLPLSLPQARAQTQTPTPAASPSPEPAAALEWQPLPLPRAHVDLLGDKQVQALAINPLTPTTLYAGTASHGLYKTIDGGQSWMTTSLTVANIIALEIDPQNPDIVYVGTGYEGIFKSANNGAIWQQINEGLAADNPAIWSLTIDPQQPDTVYAGVWGGGLWRSSDGGEKWLQLSATLSDTGELTGTHVMDIVVDSIDSHHLYAITIDVITGTGEAIAVESGRFVQSWDGGQSWDIIFAGSGRSIALDPTNPQIVYAATHPQPSSADTRVLHRSLDAGQSWEQLDLELTIYALAVDPFNPDTLYAATGSGLHRSFDRGITWTKSGEADGVFFVLTTDPTVPGTIYAGAVESSGGIFKTTASGNVWFPANRGATPTDKPVELLALAFTSQPNEVIAGTNNGIYRTISQRINWALVSLVPNNLHSLILNPQSNGRQWYAAAPEEIWRSDDGLASWQVIDQETLTATINHLIIDPNVTSILYAATIAGVYKSSDSGSTWARSATLTTTVRSLWLDLHQPDVIYAGSESGLFYSPDGGIRWQQLDEIPVHDLTQDPTGALYPATAQGLYRYADLAAPAENLRSRPVQTVVVDPLQPTTIYIVTATGLEQSLDRGQSWQALQVPGGIPTDLQINPIARQLYVATASGWFYAPLPAVSPELEPAAPSDALLVWQTSKNLTLSITKIQEFRTVRSLLAFEEHLYAGTRGGGVFISDDGGQSWQPVSDGLTDLDVWSLLAVEGRLYAGTDGGGVFVSHDGGLTWQPISDGLTDLDVLSLLAVEGRLYAGTDGGGVFVSHDGGLTWQPISDGLTDLDVWSLLAVEGRLYAGTDGGGVFVSDDGGLAWQPVSDGLTSMNVLSLLAVEGRLYAGTDGGGLFVSDDSGQSWQPQPVSYGLIHLDIWSLLAVEGHLYAGTFGGIFVSEDSGQSWQPVSDGLTSVNVRSLLAVEGHLYAGTSGGVFVSDDGGQSWQPVSDGLPNSSVRSLLAVEGHLYAGTSGGVFVSDDGGLTWQPVSNGLVDVTSLMANGGRLYAGTSGGVFVSDDGGQSWQPVSDGLPNSVITSLLAVEGHLYAGTGGDGLFVSHDGGLAWQSVSDGLPNSSVRSLLAVEGHLYAGTSGGVFVSDDGGQSWQPVSDGLPNSSVLSLLAVEGHLYAGTFGGVFVSDNGSQVWQPVSESLVNVSSLLTVEGHLYAGTSSGIFVSDDGGQVWQPASDGLTDLDILSLLAVEGRLYAGTFGGVFVSHDGGLAWRSSNNLPFRQSWIDIIFVPIRAFAANRPCLGTSGQGVYCYSDRDGWQKLSQDRFPFSLQNVNALLEVSDQLYVGTSVSLFKYSPQNAVLWQKSTPGMNDIQALAKTESWMYALNANRVLLVGDDAGASWHTRATNLPLTHTHQLLANTQTLHAATDDGYYRSQDDGQSWQAPAPQLTGQAARQLAFAGPLTDTLYAATPSGLFRSEDGGDNWGRLFGGDFYSVAVDPLSPQVVYAAADGQLLLSADAGTTWNEVPLPPDMPLVDLVAIGAGQPNTLWAANKEGGQIAEGAVNHALLARQVESRAAAQLAQGNLPEAQNLYQQVLAMVEAAGDKAGQTTAHYRLGRIALQVEANETALAHYQEAMTLNKTTDALDSAALFEVDAGLGQLYQGQNQPEAALMHYRQALASAENLADETALAPVYLALGRLYQANSDDAAALDSYLAALELAPGLIDQANLPQVHYEVGRLFEQLDQPENALAQYDQAIALDDTLGEAYSARGWLRYRSEGRRAAEADWQRAEALGVNVARPPSPWPWLMGVGAVVLALTGGAGWQFQQYRRRWATSAPLTQLLVLLSPPRQQIDPDQIKSQLAAINVPVAPEQIELELQTATQERLLKREGSRLYLNQSWWAWLLQKFQGQKSEEALANRIRHEHPLAVNAHRFFERAGFALELVAEPLLYRAASPSALQKLLPASVYLRLLPGETLDGQHVADIRQQVKEIDPAGRTALTITDHRPTDGGWAQIGALKTDEQFTLLPIESTLVNEGLGTGRERIELRSEIEKRLGSDYDPYDVRDPVAGAFSFFGRDALLEDILRRLSDGRPVGIFGLRKLGKSSLLHALRDRAAFPAAVINLQTISRGRESLPDLYRRVLRHWSQEVQIKAGLDWSPPALETGSPTGSFINTTLDLLDQLAATQPDARLGLFLDEVELIVPRPDGSGPDLGRYLTLLRALRGLIDEDGRLSLAVASLNPSINRINAWEGEQNPTFNLFQEVNLPPLTDEDCIQMVRSIGAQVGLVYSPESQTAIKTLSGGHPFLARQLCSLLYRRRNYQVGEIKGADIPGGVETFIYDDQTVTHLDAGIWQDAGNAALWGRSGGRVNQALLADLARAAGPVSKATLLDHADADARRSALLNLERFQIIRQPQPDHFALRFGLLRHWLRRRKLGLEG